MTLDVIHPDAVPSMLSPLFEAGEIKIQDATPISPKEEYLFHIRSLTPWQATGNTLAIAFKGDVLEGVILVTSYATTVRQKALDFAAKMVKTGGEIILKVTQILVDKIIWQKNRSI